MKSRFNADNVANPTYQALVELGKVEKTLFLCDYLPSASMKQEVHDGLNVVENFNGVNDFIRYGRGGRTIEAQAIISKLSQRDFAALNPLFHSHINPYGVFDINLSKASFLEAA